jgi:O-antigen/teichoic acid export membrane protein
MSDLSAQSAPDFLIGRPFKWLGNPFAYTICGPLATIAGSGTTIAAPIVLDPASFAHFALLMSIFQYVGDLDLGLSRLMDRRMSGSGAKRLEELRLFMIARSCVAACVSVLVLVVALGSGVLTAVAGMAGVVFMLACGPLSFYRASSNIYAFTTTALLIQAGLSLPRLTGLLVGGVSGCVIAMAAWFMMIAIVSNAPFVGIFRQRNTITINQIRGCFKESLPLCAFSSLWLLYLFSSRWFSWVISSPIDAGLFAFGTNLLSVGVGLIALVASVYYPRHLATRNMAALRLQLLRLLIVVTAGVLGGTLFCRFGLGLLFPHFRAASSATAVILISGVPLCLCTWLMPMVIALSRRPWREGIFMFSISLANLFLLMHIGAQTGVLGQAWASIPPAIALLGMVLYLIVQTKLLAPNQAVHAWSGMIIAVAACGGLWYFLFV